MCDYVYSWNWLLLSDLYSYVCSLFAAAYVEYTEPYCVLLIKCWSAYGIESSNDVDEGSDFVITILLLSSTLLIKYLRQSWVYLTVPLSVSCSFRAWVFINVDLIFISTMPLFT